jgi:transcriptional regulator with XRE-family HTH domain
LPSFEIVNKITNYLRCSIKSLLPENYKELLNCQKEEIKDEKQRRIVFWRQVENLLKEKGMSKGKFAHILGITHTMLKRYINGVSKPSSKIMQKISMYLNIPEKKFIVSRSVGRYI